MKTKSIFIFALAFLTLLTPFTSSAQKLTGTYGHSQITETSVVISGQVSGTGFQTWGYAIVFGTIPGLLINVVPIIPDISGNYFVKISNLLGDTNYYYKMVYGITATSMGPVKNFKTSNSSLILNHKSVNQNGAKLYGSVSPGHPKFVIKYGKTTALKDGTFSLSINSSGDFEEYFPVSLPPNTRIYYQAVNPLLPLIVYSPIKNFKTTEEKVTFDFRNLTSSSVSVFGKITNGTPAPMVLVTQDGPVSANTLELQNVPVLSPDNTWEADFDGLLPETKYYARVVSSIDPSMTYLVKTFTTPSSNINLQFFNITDSSMKVSGRMPTGTDSVILCFATSLATLSTAPDCGSGPLFEAVQDSETFETTVTNLASNTTYYFVVRDVADTANLSEVFDVQTFPPASPGTVGGSVNLPSGPASLVPCSGLDCDFAQLMKLVNNIINFLLKTIALPLFALLFAYVGWLYLSSADNPSQRSKAKGILKNAIIGFIIAMAAFIIIKTLLSSLGYEGISFGILPV